MDFFTVAFFGLSEFGAKNFLKRNNATVLAINNMVDLQYFW